MIKNDPLNEALGELLCIGITALIAWIKKRHDLKKLRKEGKLKD